MEVQQVTKMMEAQGKPISYQTIRIYENNGLIPSLSRRPGERRHYNDTAVEFIKHVVSLRELGLNLPDIKDFQVVIPENEKMIFTGVGGDNCELDLSTLSQGLIGEVYVRELVRTSPEAIKRLLAVLRKLKMRKDRLREILKKYGETDVLLTRVENICEQMKFDAS